jgi:DNA-binding NarL/FixJ family response regulator
MPGMNGFEALRKSLEILPDLKIIAFSVYTEEQYYNEMRELGAKGFVQKTSGITELEYAVKIVMKGESYFTNKTSKIVQDEFRQNDVLKPKGEMHFFPWFESQKNKSVYYE